MIPADMLSLSAGDLSRRIAERAVSCRDLMKASLQRIDELNPRFNALVSLRPADELMAQADARDRQLAQGQRLGWMHGFPVAVKDLADAQGLVTTMGSPATSRQPAARDALFVERMKRAGAIVIGKSNTPEFGLGSHTYNNVFGTTVNAYDETRTAGGSSGGAAVSLALRMVPVADGSDMGGSLRNPAAWNNVVGFRPSRGRVPAVPAEDVFYQQLATEGPDGPQCRRRGPPVVDDGGLGRTGAAVAEGHAAARRRRRPDRVRARQARRLAGQHLAGPAAGAGHPRNCARRRCASSSRSVAASSPARWRSRASRTGRPGCGCGSSWSAANWGRSMRTPRRGRR